MKRTEKEIEKAIDIYVKKYCIKKYPECTNCHNDHDEVMYDNEASGYYCHDCLGADLRLDLPTLFDLTETKWGEK